MPAHAHCEYIEHRDDDRPHRGFWYCTHRAIQVTPGEGRCSAAECSSLAPTNSAVGGLAASAPQATAPDLAVPAAAPAPANPPVQETITMPAARTKILWDEPASQTNPDFPAEVTLRDYAAAELPKCDGVYGAASALAKSIHPLLSVVRLRNACSDKVALKPDTPAAPAPAPAPAPAVPAASPPPEGAPDNGRQRKLLDTLASTEGEVHRAFDLIEAAGPHCLAEFLDDFGLTDVFSTFSRGWLRRNRRELSAVLSN